MRSGEMREIVCLKHNGKGFQNDKIPKLLNIFYIKKLHKCIAINTDINLNKTNGD